MVHTTHSKGPTSRSNQLASLIRGPDEGSEGRERSEAFMEGRYRYRDNCYEPTHGPSRSAAADKPVPVRARPSF
ncbi:hypothetical protein VTJ49DRAFT_388 [Mycothermus thermophilus]|uniref:Uncharacterized protein n=1 Tax=Humicola insolens TaxID=85995 RepID=A0ABR3VPU5_HUMIN